MATTCRVIGDVATLGLKPAADIVLRIAPEVARLTRAGDTAIVPAPEIVPVGADGSIEVDLLPGRYVICARRTNGTVIGQATITVPATATEFLSHLLDLPPPTSLDAAQQAVKDAQDAAQEARDAADESINLVNNLVTTAVTLPAGSPATATFTASTTTIEFGIPEGAQGPQGPPGQRTPLTVTSAVPNNIVAVASPAVAAYSALTSYTFVASAANTGAMTLAVDGLPARPVVTSLGTPLTAGAVAAGQMIELVFDPTINAFRVTGGMAVAAASPPVTFTTGVSPHASPALGDWWWDTVNDVLFVFANNGGGSAWTDVSTAGGGQKPSKWTESGTPPLSPSPGDRWFDTSNDTLSVYVASLSAWKQL